jgi:CRP-like cAMP-binding protein
MENIFNDVAADEIAHLRRHGVRQCFRKGQLIFAEGDPGDAFYIIDQGAVSIFFTSENGQVPLCSLSDGEYFGEMGIINNDKRSASARALEDTTLLRIGSVDFNDFVKSRPVLSEKLNRMLARRCEELILRERLIDATGIQGKHLYLSIKGDPSLRESALFRERYESPVDKILEPLSTALQQLMTDYCVYQLMINFNSGEVRARSVFDPFRESLHTANRLAEPAYLKRHFQKIAYDEKVMLIRSVNLFISTQPQFTRLPAAWCSIFRKSQVQWQPMQEGEIMRLMSKLPELRNVQNFYLRNYSISITQDAIRMQFNCDGTHIVSAVDYQAFIERNF